jgi:hypothetical protein
VVNVPVQNLTDNLTWTKGAHTLSFGGNWRGIQNNRGSDANSYSGASTNPYWMDNTPNDPSMLGSNIASVGNGFANSYEIAYATLVGTVPESTQRYNYSVTSANSGTLFSDGAMINRHFKANEFEYFLQDSWRITSATPSFRRRMKPRDSRFPPPSTPTSGSSSARLLPLRATPSKTRSPSHPAARPTIDPVTGPSRRRISLPVSPPSTRPTPKPPSAPAPACTSITSARAL